MASDNGLPEHVEDSVQTLAEVHLEHYRSASTRQRLLDRITDALARPISVIALGIIFAVWATLIALSPGEHDREAYAGLELTATIAALLVAVLILVTQTRQDQLAERREQLTLELALIADKRLAKLIGLVEEVRSASCATAPRTDAEVKEMAEPVDATIVLEEIDRRAKDKST